MDSRFLTEMKNFLEHRSFRIKGLRKDIFKKYIYFVLTGLAIFTFVQSIFLPFVC